MLDEWNAQKLDQRKAKIKRELLSRILPVARPHAYLLTGQPGAGKSTMAKIFTCKHQENIAFISGDDYRKDHHRYWVSYSHKQEITAPRTRKAVIS